MSDIHFDVQKVIADGDTVVVHWTAGGTFDGPLTNAAGQTFQPTGNKGRQSGMLMAQVQGGKIVREYTYWDQLELLQTLGVLPG